MNGQQQYYQPPQQGGLACSKCGSNNVQVQAVAEVKKKGCLKILLYLILLCIPIIGWIALFKLFQGNKSKTVNYSVCQNCGSRIKL